MGVIHVAGRRCTATSKRTGTQCGAWAVPGLDVCQWHGAATPAAQAKAARIVERQAAELAAQRIGVPVQTTPQQALLDEVQRAAGMVAYYGARVEEIANENREDLIRGVTKEETRVGFQPGTTKSVEAVPNIWLTLWNEERDRLARVSTAAIRAGIEERRVELAEREGVLVASVVRRVLDEMLNMVVKVAPNLAHELTRKWFETVSVVVPRELRALDSTERAV